MRGNALKVVYILQMISISGLSVLFAWTLYNRFAEWQFAIAFLGGVATLAAICALMWELKCNLNKNNEHKEV